MESHCLYFAYSEVGHPGTITYSAVCRIQYEAFQNQQQFISDKLIK